MNNLDMTALAERGAAVRLQELEAERTLILQAFPALNGDPSPAPLEPVAPAPRPWRTKKPTTKRVLSAKRRADISKRMKAYWRRKREVGS